MTKYSKINMVYRLQKWMDSVPGQTFLNYAYSWGAAVVILGTLFKLTHLPGANLMLYLGMGTEVVVFFLSAFDRPFDKTADGMELPTHLAAEGDDLPEGIEVANQSGVAAPAAAAVSGGGIIGGGSVIVGGGSGTIGEGVVSGGSTVSGGGGQTIIIGGGGVIGGGGHGHSEPSERADIPETSEHTGISEVPATAVPASIPPLTPDMTEATNAYVEELKNLTEVLERVSEQSKRLTTDSEEMENLNRTLTGICKVYEMQLKSASSQIGTIDEINEQTKKMAQQIEQLNNIYARMIEAMTMKMKAE